jgi:hypothetical protein
MFNRLYQKIFYSYVLWVLSIPLSYALTLQQAEQYAVTHAPEIQQLRSTSEALKQSAIAKGAFDDPKLGLGVSNLPVDTFSFY